MCCVRTEPASPLVSILCGVIGAVVVVFLVIVVTMKVRILLSPASHFKHPLSEFYSFNIMCNLEKCCDAACNVKRRMEKVKLTVLPTKDATNYPSCPRGPVLALAASAPSL